MTATPSSASLVVDQESPGVLLVRLSGNGREQGIRASEMLVQAALSAPGAKSLSFESANLSGWDSRFVAFIRNCSELCRSRQIEFRDCGLPEGVRRLLRLAEAVPEKKDAHHAAVTSRLLQRMGEHALRGWASALEMFTFLGENIAALGNLLRGRAQFRWSDAFLVMQECGPQALGIVLMINFLVGLILAFVGAVQLMKFGASIYVADLVAIATVREMGCIMTGIILCGRTGAAFAAQLGTMKVNEEINAYKAFGISPNEFLVLPRILGLMLMMPLLCVFADLIGIFGGFVGSTLLRHIAPSQYIQPTLDAVHSKHFALGIAKGSSFGDLV